MTIDRSTIANLEILSNARSAKSKCSLINAIDCTVTNVGAHLLKANLISPSTSKPTIEARLNLLDSFLGDERFFYQVLECLERLPDLEKTLAGLTLNPRAISKGTVTLSHTTRGIASLVCLKTTLQVMPGICKAIESNSEKKKEAEEEEKNKTAGEDDLSGELIERKDTKDANTEGIRSSSKMICKQQCEPHNGKTSVCKRVPIVENDSHSLSYSFDSLRIKFSSSLTCPFSLLLAHLLLPSCAGKLAIAGRG